MTSNNFGHENFEGFAYLDYHNPAVSWNLARGAFCTPSELPPEEFNNSFLSVATAGMLSNSTPKRLYTELAIDSVRASIFPNCVSRLSGFFVFDEIDSISRFWDCNSWGGHFSDKYLSDVGVSATKSTRVDSNWIAHIVDVDGGLKADWHTNTEKYWHGEICPGSEPIWERIVEGFLNVWSSNVRQEAYIEIQAISPNSLPLLHYSSLCAAYGSFDGLIFPYLIRENESDVKIIYISRIKQLSDANFISKLVENAKKMPFIKVGIDNKTYNNEAITAPNLAFLNTTLSSQNECAFADFVKLINQTK
ncbi:hypothetical protein HCH73_04275 [Citrobacter koseri]|uniref:hypothetical protein n=1 Tax=Citrobacter koseri TaxID=545 RepID=UPI0018E1C1DE|nr:hypothetical protein [Citrobacter koseri]MBI0676261.1 hypothetical protein [Citrobacter koseri]